MTKADDNEKFVRAYQALKGLRVDGWAGADTLNSLNAQKPNVASHSLKNPSAFFQAAKAVTGSLTQSQVDGFNSITSVLSDWPISWVAYALATAYHETAASMQPIKELGGDSYFKRRYDIQGENPDLARRLGNVHPGDGAKYAGRGYVQLTGRANYAKYGLQDKPDEALRPDIAARIMKQGMETGAFTGKKLADYLPGDYVNARRIINGTDKASKIAGYATAFEAALAAGGW